MFLLQYTRTHTHIYIYIYAHTHARARSPTTDAPPFSQAATKSDNFVPLIADGRLITKPFPVRFSSTGLTFGDGSSTELDAVIVCTGYRPVFPYVRFLTASEAHPGRFYRNVIHPDYPTLAFVGFARPAIGAIPPTAEMQARWIASVTCGRCVLPSAAEMRRRASKASEEKKRDFPAVAHPTVLVHWIPYMDEFAADVGCRPQPWRLLTQPRLLWKLVTGPFVGLHYRLHGSSTHPDAAKLLMHLPRGHDLDELILLTVLNFYSAAFSLLGSSRMRSSSTFV
jgi:dimethylaniline monooxygenase (N-oxide forming)